MTHSRFPEHMPLQNLLDNLAAELQSLASAMVEIENKVGEAIAMDSPSVSQVSHQLQGLDQLAQITNEIAIFIRAISESVNAEVSVSVSRHINVIRLRNLAHTLAGQSVTSPSHEEKGDVDLF